MGVPGMDVIRCDGIYLCMSVIPGLSSIAIVPSVMSRCDHRLFDAIESTYDLVK